MILFIDDEEHYVQPYIDELRFSGYDVILHTDVDLALEFFEANHERIDLLILDIMMAPGESFEHERTLAGRRTGIFFYERVRRTAPDMPVIVLTNVPNAISKISDREVKELLEGDEHCWFFRKMTLLPIELREEIERVIGVAREGENDIHGG
jgi:DNA-binding response OmpR family regulator